jgi:hypothetical protein
MWLYFFSSAMAVLTVTYFTWKMKISWTLYDIVVGSAIALFASVAASSFPLDTTSLTPVLIIAAGFFVFGFADICWHAIFIFPVGVNRLNRFLWFFAAYPLANIIVAGGVVVISIFATQNGVNVPAVAQVLAIVVLMALRNLAVAVYGATFERMEGITWKTQFNRYGTAIHGRRVIIVIIAAVFYLSLTRGLEIVNL